MPLTPLTTDFSILEKIGFEREPVAIKFELYKPEEIDRLENPLALCEMIRACQNGDKPFYMDKDNENCMGKGAMGMMEGPDPAWAVGGLIGPEMGVFKDRGANMRCMTHYTTFAPNSVHYICFSKLSQLAYEPDLLVFSGDVKKCGILLRAMSYSTGEAFISKSTPVFQCSWIFSYPFLTGNVNYVIMGMGHGTTARKCYEPGEMLVMIPNTWFGTILENLKTMKFVARGWEGTREDWMVEEAEIYAKLISDCKEAGF